MPCHRSLGLELAGALLVKVLGQSLVPDLQESSAHPYLSCAVVDPSVWWVWMAVHPVCWKAVDPWACQAFPASASIAHPLQLV